jgi:hypothetical protein
MKAVDPSDLDRFSERMRTRAAQLGARVGRPAAEVFKKISDL